MKTNFFVFLVSTLVLLCTGCANDGGNYLEEKKSEPILQSEDEPDTNINVQGTNWKLAGIVDSETNILEELKPKDCDRCYTLNFDTDSTGFGWSTTNQISINLQGARLLGIMTAVGERGDGYLFGDILYFVDSYKLENNELKFFYNDCKNYLLYKKIHKMISLTDIDSNENYRQIALTDTTWQFTGFVDTNSQTVELAVPYYNFYIKFNTDKSLFGRSGNILLGSYDVNLESSTVKIIVEAVSEVIEPLTGELYIERLNNVTYFSLTEKGLMLQYNSQNYLLFKPKQ
jgi:hypothetical protein